MAQYLLKNAAIQEALGNLLEASIHRMFPGYLCLKQQSSIHERDNNLSFPYTDFFEEYLRVPGGDKPYLVPFTASEDPSDETLWVNDNVSGTYAPSSLRADSPFTKVVEVEKEGHNSRWRLQPNHWQLAKHHLCEGQTIPAESLIAFLFRDYAFETAEPSAYTLVQVFQEDFGYELSKDQFTTLFHTGDSNITQESFQRYE